MCFGGGAKSNPAPPPPVPAPPPVPNKQANRNEVVGAGNRERRRAALAKGSEDTILTGPLGDVSQANVKRKSLLGE